MPYKNIDDKRESARRYYRNNREKQKHRTMERKKKIYNWYKDYKNKLSCSICGESCSQTLDFHHINNNDKLMTITNMVRQAYSIERIRKEIDKCIVLCCNCHRKVHCGVLKLDK